MNADHERARAFHFAGGQHGCLLLHGFTGTPGHMLFLGERLRDQGYAVSAPLLPGHGATLEAMRASNWHQWLDAARTCYQALRAQCELVTVIGLSMGGTLALVLAEEYPVDSLVCISPAIRTREPFSWAARALALVRPIRKGEGDAQQIKRKDFLYDYDFGYDGLPVAKVHDLRVLMHLAERNLFAVTAPTLVLQPARDETVDPKGAQIILRGISSQEKGLIMLEESSHVATLGCEREAVLSSILKQLRHIDDIK